MHQEIDATGVQKGIDATARFWMFAIVRVVRGTVRYLQGDRSIAVPTPRYAIYAPRYSIVEAVLERLHSHSEAIVSATPLANDLPRRAVVIPDPPDRLPSSAADVEEILRMSRRMIQVGRYVESLSFAARVKDAIDESYAVSQPLSGIAHALGIAPSTMSRSFRKAYGMPPVHYRHHLRIMDGMVRLLHGEAVTDVCQDVGFGDLSRFYRHFRSLTLAPPARYRLRESAP